MRYLYSVMVTVISNYIVFSYSKVTIRKMGSYLRYNEVEGREGSFI